MSTEMKPVGIKRALVVAISEYDNLEPLRVCKKDGNEVLKLLEKNDYVIQKDHRLIGRVNHSTLRDKVYDFFHDQNISPEDTILFFFSGHGIPGDDGEHYFASSEIDPDGPRKRGLSFGEYTDFMSDCNSKVIFSILDCCYSGAAKPSKGNKTAESKKGESIIKEKLEGEGKCTLSSCKPMQKSYLLEKNSVFTTFLLEGFRGGDGRSADEKGCVTPDLLLNYIDWKIRSLPSDKRPDQTPFLRCERTGGKIILSQFGKFSKLRVSQPEETRNTRYFLQQGNNSFYKGEYQNAIKVYDKIIKDPNFITAIYNKGLVLDKLGKYRQAITLYKRALDINPRYFDALFTIGYTLNNLENNEEAIKWYDKALGVRPNDPYSLYNKGLSLYHLGEIQQAITWYDKVLKIEPNNKEAIYNKALALNDLGKYEEAIKWYDKALELDREDRDAIHNKGLALYSLHKYQRAITWYDKVLKIEPNDSDALYNKAMALDDMRKYRQAIEWYDKALKIDPKNSNIVNNKGLALYNLHKYQEAIKWYDKALELDSKHIDAIYNKALALDGLGKYEEAIKWYDKALELDPKNREIMKSKVITEKRISRNRK